LGWDRAHPSKLHLEGDAPSAPFFPGKKFTQIGKADWTNSNPEITAALKGFGRVGVPLYVLYPAADPSNPVVLPELLTESILVDVLKKLP